MNAKLINRQQVSSVYNPQPAEVWTKHKLLSLLTQSDSQEVTIKGVTGYMHGISREDGSGSSFNVTLLVGCGKVTIYVRTID